MPDKMKLIAVTGGIGSGKSVVCRILAAMGHPVYDCDSNAKRIMDSTPAIHDAIACRISGDAIARCGGTTAIDRRTLADIVFNDPEKLSQLNGIVHSAVKRDLAAWRDAHAATDPAPGILFVETAILRQSGLDAMVDEIWEVTADAETRIARAMQRDKASRAHIEARIKSQAAEEPATARADGIPLRRIDNDGRQPLIPQLLRLLNDCSGRSKVSPAQ